MENINSMENELVAMVDAKVIMQKLADSISQEEQEIEILRYELKISKVRESIWKAKYEMKKRSKPTEDKCATCELKNLRHCGTCAHEENEQHLEPCRSCVGKLELPNWRAK